jgi:hypothetical protein
MGASFTNVQVFTGGTPPGAAPGALAEALRAAARERGLVEGAAGEPADRTIIIAPAGPGPWLAIYDQATERQDLQLLDDLAARAAHALDGFAVAVLVHDSDALELRLFDRGGRTDRYCNAPEYCARVVPGAEPAGAEGHPERWRPLLRPGAEPAALRAAWDERALFAEQTLARTAELLGWDSGRASVGFDSLDREEPGLTPLRFRRVRPAADPPRFTTGEFVQQVTLAPGAPLRLSCTVASAGGPGRGIGVIAWGEALDEGLVAVEEVEILRLLARRPEVVRGGLPPLQAGAARAARPLRGPALRAAAFHGGRHGVFAPGPQAARRVLLAGLPAVEIPASAATAPPDLTPERLVDAVTATRLHATLLGRALRPGAAPLHVALAPLANRAGAATCTVELTIGAARP